MTRRIVALFGVATLLAAAALADSPDPTDHKALRVIGEGRGIYIVKCSGCHGADARGGWTHVNHAAAPDLTLIAVHDGGFDAVHVAQHIDGRLLGTPNVMPHFGQAFASGWPYGEGFAATRIYTVTRYLDFIQREAAPAEQ